MLTEAQVAALLAWFEQEYGSPPPGMDLLTFVQSTLLEGLNQAGTIQAQDGASAEA